MTHDIRRSIMLCEAINLIEGLIKVPPKLEQSVLSLLNMHLLWMLRDKAGKAYPEHRKAVIAHAKALGVSLPKSKWVKPAKGFIVEQLPLDVSDLPATYAKLTPKHKGFFVVLDYGHMNLQGGEDTGAYYSDRPKKDGSGSNSLIVIHMEKLRGVPEFPTRRSPEEVPYILDVIAEHVHHELQHMIQYVLLAPVDKQQIDHLPDYKEHKTGYYASQVEYDPQIGSAVAEFVEHWHILSDYHKQGQMRGGLNLSKSIKQFVGMAPTSLGTGFALSRFFRALRQSDDRQRYRTAIKKFVIGVGEQLKP